MFLVWNDARSFQRHLEAMRKFQQSHGNGPVGEPLLRERALPRDISTPRKNSRMMRLTDTRGNVIIVPIWKIPIPPGSQN